MHPEWAFEADLAHPGRESVAELRGNIQGKSAQIESLPDRP